MPIKHQYNGKGAVARLQAFCSPETEIRGDALRRSRMLSSFFVLTNQILARDLAH